MIRELDGTIFITADAFCDRYNLARRGQCFSYATGDLVHACEIDTDARVLWALVLAMEEAKKLKLDIRERRDLKPMNGPTSFEYLATKLVSNMASRPLADERRPEPACA